MNKHNKNRILNPYQSTQNSRRRAIRGLLHVSGDGLRVVDDDTKGLIVDQTIEKVSFCAPDRNHERGFSYICRDGTTRRWMCHGFLASKDSGERLSHAVGCAFAVCLERKQRRDTECGVTMTFDMKNSTFTRSGSFRTQTMTERLQNGTANGGTSAHLHERGIDVGGGGQPPAAIVKPLPKPHNPFAIERPHVTATMLERLERQGSFRAVSNQSPFKRQMSLRLNDLPSNAERQKSFLDPMQQQHHHHQQQQRTMRSVSPIPEVSPHKPSDTVAQLCAELSQGLSLLTTRNEMDAAAGLSGDLNFNNAMSINQNTNTASASTPSTISLIHSPLSPPVVSVFPPLSATLGQSTAQQHYKSASPPSSAGSVHSATSSMRAYAPPDSLPHSLNNGRQQHQFGSSPTSVVTPPMSAATVAAVGAVVVDQQQQSQQQQRRPPVLSVSARSRSLNTSQSPTVGSDPFDAEWVASVAKLSNVVGSTAVTTDVFESVSGSAMPTSTHHNTNPFISPPKPPAQSFQVQL